MIARALVLVLAGTAGVWLAPAGPAQSAPPAASERVILEELKAQEDPTILTRRAWADTEWNKYKDGSRDLDETLGALWSWRLSDHQEWAVRFKLPFRSHSAGTAAGDADRQGLGDIKLAAGTAFRLSESWRSGVGVEMRFPSASDNLGGNAWRPQVFGAVSWDATRQLTLSPSFEYNKSIAEKRNAAPQHFMEMYFPATYILPQHWAVTARYEAKVDFEDNDRWTHAAKVVIAKQLEGLPLGFSLSIKKPLDPVNKDFQINFAVTYFLRSQ